MLDVLGVAKHLLQRRRSIRRKSTRGALEVRVLDQRLEDGPILRITELLGTDSLERPIDPLPRAQEDEQKLPLHPKPREVRANPVPRSIRATVEATTFCRCALTTSL